MVTLLVLGALLILLLGIVVLVTFRNRPPKELPVYWQQLMHPSDETSDHGLVAEMREDVGELGRT